MGKKNLSKIEHRAYKTIERVDVVSTPGNLLVLKLREEIEIGDQVVGQKGQPSVVPRVFELGLSGVPP